MEISVPEDADNERERSLGTLVEVYTPITFAGESELQGSFEIYQYYEPTAIRINYLRSWILDSIGLGFLVLYGAFVSIAWRGWKLIERQQSDLRQSMA